jgi:hypothetical protein
MKQHMEAARSQLGSLAAMAHQTEAMERKILARAQSLLADVERGIEKGRVEAVTGDDAAKERYAEMVMERGRLQQVVAQARAALA